MCNETNNLHEILRDKSIVNFNPFSEKNIDHNKSKELHALFLEQQGFFLLPLKPDDKVPDPDLLPRNKAGHPSWSKLNERAASKLEIKAWFDQKPNLNIGLICGPASCLYVLDVDRKPPKDIEELPPTVMVKTGRGWHYYYKSNKTIKTVALGKWGSLQGDGSYVVAAGSVHPGGAIYEYADTMGINEIEIADLPEWLANGRIDKNRVREKLDISSQNISFDDETFSILSRKRHRKNSFTMPCKFKELQELNQDPEIAIKILEACGRKVERLGKAFRCPIPGHTDRKPSAALWQEPNQAIVLHDFHTVDPERRFWPLVDVYASCKIGSAICLRPGERAVWWLRALHEIGIISLPSLLKYPLPASAKKKVQIVYDGFCYLLELRQLHEPSNKAPYNRTFAANWCGIDKNAVRRGMTWLLREGYLSIAERGRPNKHPEGPALTFFAINRPKNK